jgi:hypothetical protein
MIACSSSLYPINITSRIKTNRLAGLGQPTNTVEPSQGLLGLNSYLTSIFIQGE